MSHQTKTLFLLGLLLVGGAIILWGMIPDEDPPQKTQKGRKTNLGSVSLSIPTPPPPLQPRNGPFAPPKNIFAPLPQGDSPLDQAPSPPAPAPRVPQPSPAALPPLAPDEIAARQALRDMSAFRLLGYIVQHGEIQAFLSHEQHIYLIQQGQTVEGRFQVTALDRSSLTLHDTHTGVQTIFEFKQH